MSTTSRPVSSSTPGDSAGRRPQIAPAPVLQQIRALADTEWRLLLRNKVAALNSLALPLMTAALFVGIGGRGLGLGASLPITVFGTALLFVVYYTLVTALVARRESLLLKRLRTGEADDATIIAGLATPFAVIAMVQCLLAIVASVAFFDVPLHPRLLLFVIGAVLAIIAWTQLAVASTGVTRSVEHAQITTLPVVLIPLLLSGLSIPLAMMPELLRRIAEIMPLTPVVELGSLAFAGVTSTGNPLGGIDLVVNAIRPLLVLVVWALIGHNVSRRLMRWEARS